MKNRRLRDLIDVSADLAQIAAVGVPVVVAVVVVIAGQPLAAFIAAFVVSLAANVALVIGVRRLVGERRKTSDAGGAPGSASSAWIPDPGDLLRWEFVQATFEETLTRASGVGEKHLADDAVVHFDAFRVLPRPMVMYRAYSEIAGKRCVIEVHPADERVTGRARGSGWGAFGEGGEQREVWPEPEVPPWREDTNWQELVRLSWLRVRPFVGSIELQARTHAIADEGWSIWHICYQRAWLEDEAPLPAECYSLEKGRLSRIFN